LEKTSQYCSTYREQQTLDGWKIAEKRALLVVGNVVQNSLHALTLAGGSLCMYINFVKASGDRRYKGDYKTR